jgi:hypothetical protein
MTVCAFPQREQLIAFGIAHPASLPPVAERPAAFHSARLRLATRKAAAFPSL